MALWRPMCPISTVDGDRRYLIVKCFLWRLWLAYFARPVNKEERHPWVFFEDDRQLLMGSLVLPLVSDLEVQLFSADWKICARIIASWLVAHCWRSYLYAAWRVWSLTAANLIIAKAKHLSRPHCGRAICKEALDFVFKVLLVVVKCCFRSSSLNGCRRVHWSAQRCAKAAASESHLMSNMLFESSRWR